MALAIMYYAHTHHLKDASITSSKEVITPNAAKGLAKLSMTGDGAAVQALLDSGVDATVTDDLGRTALMLAALHSRKPGAIKALLGHRVIDVNARDSNGKTALMLAARFSKNPDVVKVLLRDKRIDVNARDNNGKTILMHLSKHSSPEIVILLLQKGAELKSADLEKVGFTSAHTQEDLLRQMVGRLPSETKDQEVFRMLKAYLLNVTAQDDGFINGMIGEIKDEGMRSEIEGVKKGLHEERLLKLAQEKRGGVSDTALLIRALLKDKKIDINARDSKNRTALMLAAQYSRNPDIIRVLLEHGAMDVSAIDGNGRTAFMYAARFSKNPDVVKVLLRDKRIDVNARDNNGKTVLMHLSKHSSPEIVILLLQKGAELKSADLEKVGFANIETQEDLLRQMVRRLPSETKDQGVFRMLKAYLLNVTAQDDGFIDDMIGKIKDGGMSSEIECVKKELHEERLLKLAQEWGQDIADATLFLRDREVTTTFSATPSSDTSHDASVMCETTLTRADLAMAQSEDLAMTSPCPPVIEGIDVVSRALQPKQTRAITIQERLTKLLENKGFDKIGATLLSSIITTRIMEAPSKKQSELAKLSARYIKNTVGSEQRKVTPRALKAIGKDELMARCRKIVDSAEHVIDLQLASAERAP